MKIPLELQLPLEGKEEVRNHLPGQSLLADKWLQKGAHKRMKVKKQETEIKQITSINWHDLYAINSKAYFTVIFATYKQS